MLHQTVLYVVNTRPAKPRITSSFIHAVSDLPNAKATMTMNNQFNLTLSDYHLHVFSLLIPSDLEITTEIVDNVEISKIPNVEEVKYQYEGWYKFNHGVLNQIKCDKVG